MYQIFLFTKGVSIFLKIRKRQNVNQIVIDDVDMCFTNCVTQTTTTIFRENSTKILGCKDAGIVYKTHIYVHSNFLSCKMSLVFVFLSLLNFRGRCMLILYPSFSLLLVFCNFLLQQTNIEIICRRKTLGAARRF